MNILRKQENDPIIQALFSPHTILGLHDDIDIFDSRGEYIWIFSLNEVFNHMKTHYPFIVTVPEEYTNMLGKKWEMIPVCPSDRPWLYGFKWTIWRKPYIDQKEKRYIVEIYDKDNLYPYITREKVGFKWVWFLPMAHGKTLKKWVDYRVIWLYSENEIDTRIEEAKKQDIPNLQDYITQNTQNIIPLPKAVGM